MANVRSMCRRLTMHNDRQHVDCAEAMGLLRDYLDGELIPTMESAVRAHIAICARCYPRMKFETAFLAAVAATRGADPAPPALRARVVSALRSARLAAY